MLWYLFEFEYMVCSSYPYDRDSLRRLLFFFSPSKEKEGLEKDNSKKSLLDVNNNMKYKALSALLVASSLFIDLMSEVYSSVLNNC